MNRDSKQSFVCRSHADLEAGSPKGQSGLSVTDHPSSACHFVLMAARRLPSQTSHHPFTVLGGSRQEG